MTTFTARDHPVIIVGAGISGLTAAAELGQAGISVIIVEARNRIGGRILTTPDSTGCPVELGAEFIHGLPPEIWDRLQKSEIEEVKGQSWCVTPQGLRSCSFFESVNLILDAMDDSIPDESFRDFLKRKFPNSAHDAKLEEAKRRALAYVSGFNAADPALVGVHWLVAEMRAEEKSQGDRAFRSRNGYADLIDVFRRQISRYNVTIQTDTIVEHIFWKAGSVQLKASGHDGPCTLETSQVLITLPISILKNSGQPGAVAFNPPLPQDKLSALNNLEMGKVIRIVLRFQHRFWETIQPSGGRATLSDMSFLFSEDDLFPTWWTRMPAKVPLITGWAPFRSAEKLSGKSKEVVVEDALRNLSRLLRVERKDLRNWLQEAHFHDWQKDPFSLGAYSYAKVGADGSQHSLGMPIDRTLFFAGEATDTSGNNGTVHGAIASGYRAAREIIEARISGDEKIS
jgi:monoamine oxidase